MSITMTFTLLSVSAFLAVTFLDERFGFSPLLLHLLKEELLSSGSLLNEEFLLALSSLVLQLCALFLNGLNGPLIVLILVSEHLPLILALVADERGSFEQFGHGSFVHVGTRLLLLRQSGSHFTSHLALGLMVGSFEFLIFFLGERTLVLVLMMMSITMTFSFLSVSAFLAVTFLDERFGFSPLLLHLLKEELLSSGSLLNEEFLLALSSLVLQLCALFLNGLNGPLIVLILVSEHLPLILALVAHERTSFEQFGHGSFVRVGTRLLLLRQSGSHFTSHL